MRIRTVVQGSPACTHAVYSTPNGRRSAEEAGTVEVVGAAIDALASTMRIRQRTFAENAFGMETSRVLTGHSAPAKVAAQVSRHNYTGSAPDLAREAWLVLPRAARRRYSAAPFSKTPSKGAGA